MASNKVYAVANYLLLLGSKDKKLISNKKMQKLLYYSQAWHIVLSPTHERLFKDDFEAWIHGPAIPSVYGRYKKYLHNPITEKPDQELIDQHLSNNDKRLVDAIWEIYGKYDADYLELLSHNEEPWQKARATKEDHEPSNSIISVESMLDYYGKKIQAGA